MLKDMLKDKSFLVSLTIFVTAVLMVLLSLTLGSIGYGKDLAFYTLSTVILVSAFGVVTARNLVYSGFLLVLTFVMIGGLYALLNADFLAAAQVLINGGAVTIMMIFAIMLTNSKSDTANIPYSFEYKFVAFVLSGLGLFFVLFLRMTGINFVLAKPFIFTTPTAWSIKEPISVVTTGKLGEMFLGQYIVPFEIASIILLMALIGSIVLAMQDIHIKTSESTYGEEPIDMYESSKAQTFPINNTKES
ncbi:MAG: NADH-quinone oxidoreductase subunit J [Candidatus Sericytochromatia bacterium]|nr:NADH-quinone oxidoreductase subunit J [Candidatus Sericytochromatia bacterium]